MLEQLFWRRDEKELGNSCSGNLYCYSCCCYEKAYRWWVSFGCAEANRGLENPKRDSYLDTTTMVA